MNTIERDGFKEKRAKLVASRIYHMMAIDTPGAGSTSGVSAAPSSPPPSSRTTTSAPTPRVDEPPAFDSEDVDKIPF